MAVVKKLAKAVILILPRITLLIGAILIVVLFLSVMLPFVILLMLVAMLGEAMMKSGFWMIKGINGFLEWIRPYSQIFLKISDAFERWENK